MKKTLLSFLCIGSACMVMAQTTPSSSPSQNKNTTTNSVNQQNMNQQNNSLNNNSNTNLNNTPANNNMNSTTTPNGNMNGTMNNNNVNDPANPETTTSGRLNTTTNSAAYSVSVPSSIQTTFSTAYPAATSSAVWSQSGDWYRVRYRENGQLMEASYREDGKSFTRTASPVLRTYVPEEIVSKAIDMYGMNVYAIAQSKGTEGQTVYHVTVIDNGQSRTEWMNEDGSSVMSPYRVETDATMQTTNNADMKTSEQTTTEPATQSQQPAATTPDTSSMMQNNTPNNMNDQPIIEQGEGSEEVTPDNQMNTEGINNGTSSEDTIRRLNDEQSPEEQSSDVPLE